MSDKTVRGYFSTDLYKVYIILAQVFTHKMTYDTITYRTHFNMILALRLVIWGIFLVPNIAWGAFPISVVTFMFYMGGLSLYQHYRRKVLYTKIPFTEKPMLY